MKIILGFLLLASMMLTGCSLAPDYHRPQMAIPAAYKERADWRVAKRHYEENSNVPWWEVFDDPVLNQLEDKVDFANQTVVAALARFQEACAASAVTRSQLFPTINGIANANRQQTSGNVANKDKMRLFNDFYIGAILSYEIDVFGRVRNAVVASDNLAYASAADLGAVDLSLHAQLASDYFALRGYEAAQVLLDKVVVAYKKALTFVSNRHIGGIAAEADVDQAKTQLENAKTLATDMRLKQAQLKHAIAVLIGEAPAFFALPSSSYNIKFVAVPPELPSTLLRRRPDIVAAERRVRAANAQIGVARAAFFPAFNLSSALGFESEMLKNLIEMPSLAWSLGNATAISLLQPLASVTLFDGGALRGQLNEVKAIYIETVANYKQTVLSAYQEVEDNLVAQRRLAEEYVTQDAAAIAAYRALKQARNLYVGGVGTIYDIVVSENIALQTELTAINIKYQRQINSVQLIKALGGGW